MTVTVAGGLTLSSWAVSGSGSAYAKATTASAVTFSDAAASTTAQLYPGDVASFARPTADRAVTTHRIVDVAYRDGRPLFSTGGDNNAVVDPWLIHYEPGQSRGASVARCRTSARPCC